MHSKCRHIVFHYKKTFKMSDVSVLDYRNRGHHIRHRATCQGLFAKWKLARSPRLTTTWALMNRSVCSRVRIDTLGLSTVNALFFLQLLITDIYL